jgi:hypothetical protein
LSRKREIASIGWILVFLVTVVKTLKV